MGKQLQHLAAAAADTEKRLMYITTTTIKWFTIPVMVLLERNK